MPRVCANPRCGRTIADTARPHKRTCTPRCRKAVSRARQALPAELTGADRWVRRSPTKVPLTTAGTAASSTDERTWSTHAEAVASSAGVGMGFVLSDVDRIVCVDLDHCLAADGSLKPWAEEIVSSAGPTFVEVSPSGDGLHVFGYADVRQGRRIRRADGYAVEVYSSGRYIATTGRRFRNAPATLADISELVASLT